MLSISTGGLEDFVIAKLNIDCLLLTLNCQYHYNEQENTLPILIFIYHYL